MKITLLAAVALAGAATAGVVAHAGTTTKTIRVTEREFKITLSAKTVGAGPVRFQIKNTGHYPHALSISGPGVSKKTPLIQPGKTAVLAVTLRSGVYSLWCPVPGHAAEGMKATLNEATGPAGGGATTTTNGDTTTDDGGGYGGYGY